MRRHLAEMVGKELHPAAMPDWSAGPEGRTYAAECAAALEAAVRAFEPRDRLLLKLRFERELTAREIADVMGFASQFHVYRRLRAVLTVLRQTVPPAYREYVGAIA
jgi:RNA polymerase sigma factor (sigma-70 family)